MPLPFQSFDMNLFIPFPPADTTEVGYFEYWAYPTST